MVWRITVIVMVTLCGVIAIKAMQSAGARQFATSDSIRYGNMSLMSQGVVLVILSPCPISCEFPLFAFSIPTTYLTTVFTSLILLAYIAAFWGICVFYHCSLSYNDSALCMSIMPIVVFARNRLITRPRMYILTDFAVCLVTVFTKAGFAKLRNPFNLFAFGAGFQYNSIGHCRFLNKRFWLKPDVLASRTSGLFYYSTK